MKIVSLQIIAALVVAENTDVYHSKEQLSVQSSPQKGQTVRIFAAKHD